MNNHIKEYPALQFSLFRVIFGAYLSWHFFYLLPYAAEIYSNQGLLPSAQANPTFGFFPSIFWLTDAPAAVTAVIGVAAGLSVCFMLGYQRRIAAVLLWYIWACLFNRNVLTSNPSLSYVGLLLLLTAIVPGGEPFSLQSLKQRQAIDVSWNFPAGVYWTAWMLMALGYTFSGLVKLQSPSWLNGTALLHLAENPLARPGVMRELLLTMPSFVIALLTWTALCVEILFLPLSATRRSRALVWLAMVGLHLGILLVVDFADLTLGMMMLHLFTFDPQWLPANSDNRRRIVFYDGDCGFCQSSVQTCIALDTQQLLHFAPLQGVNAESILPEGLRDEMNLDTMVYARENEEGGFEIQTESDAVLGIMNDLGGLWRVISWLQLFPRALRNPVYRLVAKNRTRLSRVVACRLPTAEERLRFLK